MALHLCEKELYIYINKMYSVFKDSFHITRYYDLIVIHSIMRQEMAEDSNIIVNFYSVLLFLLSLVHCFKRQVLCMWVTLCHLMTA